MEIIANSFLLVAATEMGDKTQLLALLLACRFKKTWSILAGILVATILNHGLAAWSGQWVASNIPQNYLNIGLGSVFLAFAVWVLIPDREDETKITGKYGAFLTTLIAFFFAEMADKTQLSTVALAARYGDVALVTAGTTLGMLAADGLAVFCGEKINEKIPMRWIRMFSAGLFIVFGLWVWFGN